MSSPIKIRNTIALLAAIGLLSIALVRGISSDAHVAAARILVAECQGFEALASAGGKRLSCGAEMTRLDTGHAAGHDDGARPPIAPEQPVGPVVAPAIAHSKA